MESIQDEVDRLRSGLARSQNEDITKNKCIITGVKFEDLGCASSTKDYIMSLALSGGLRINASDIFSVDLSQPKIQRDDSCLVFVVFKTFEMKQKFIALKPGFPKNLNVMEALNKETLALFNCAKSLKRCGFKTVYHNMGKVYARRNNDYPPIHITSFNQVKELRSGSRNDTLSTQFELLQF